MRLTKLLNMYVSYMKDIGTQDINKEELILKAAEHEFLTKGFDGARTTSIAESAGVTHALLHYYFRTKKQLFERILEDKLSLLSTSIKDVLGNPSLPYEERLRDGISAHFDLFAANPDLPRFFISEVLSNEEYLGYIRERIKNIVSPITIELQQTLDAAAERGEIEHVDVRMLILDILSLNLFVFIGMPIAEHVFNVNDRHEFLEQRKRENIEIIMRRIKKM